MIMGASWFDWIEDEEKRAKRAGLPLRKHTIGASYHCRICCSEFSVRFVNQSRITGTLFFHDTSPPKVVFKEYRNCICDDCVRRTYDENDHRISDTINAAFNILHSEKINCDVEKERLTAIISETVTNACVCYDAATEDADVIHKLLTDKNIHNIYRQKKLIKKYLSENWEEHVKRVKARFDTAAIQAVLSEREQASKSNQEEFLACVVIIAPSLSNKPAYLKPCLETQNGICIDCGTKEPVDLSTATKDTVFYVEERLDMRELSRLMSDLHDALEPADLESLIDSIITGYEFRKIVRDGLLRELDRILAQKQ